MRSIVALVLLFLAAVCGYAQVTKKPAPNNALQKLAAPRKIVSIAPLKQDVKLDMVRTIVKSKFKQLTLLNSILTDPLALSVDNPFKDASNLLIFELAYTVSPYEHLVLFQALNNEPNGVLINYNAPADGFYVFDFVTTLNHVGPYQPLRLVFRNVTNDDIQDQKFNKDEGHIVFVSKGVKAGPNIFFLGEGDGEWTFHSVEISQFVAGS